MPLAHQTMRFALPQNVLQLLGGPAEVATLDIHDVDRVAMALRGQESDLGDLIHHQRVQRGGRAVRDVMGRGQHLPQWAAQLFGQHLEDIHDSLRVVRRRRRRLSREYQPVSVIEDGIGERATDVHSDHICHCRCAPSDSGRGEPSIDQPADLRSRRLFDT